MEASLQVMRQKGECLSDPCPGAEPFEPDRGSTEYIEGGDKGGRTIGPGIIDAPPFSLRPKLEAGLWRMSREKARASWL